MLEIEFDKPRKSVCKCCGEKTTTLTRFITVDDEARGVYYGAFSDKHPEPHVLVLLSLGQWWGDPDPATTRVAFGLRIWVTETQFQVSVVDADDAGWPDSELMGKRLPRAEALDHPLLKEAFHVSDHIVAEDKEVRAYFKRVECR